MEIQTVTGASTRCTFDSWTSISRAFAHRAFTSDSLIVSHLRSCSIWRSRLESFISLDQNKRGWQVSGIDAVRWGKEKRLKWRDGCEKWTTDWRPTLDSMYRLHMRTYDQRHFLIPDSSWEPEDGIRHSCPGCKQIKPLLVVDNTLWSESNTVWESQDWHLTRLTRSLLNKEQERVKGATGGWLGETRDESYRTVRTVHIQRVWDVFRVFGGERLVSFQL